MKIFESEEIRKDIKIDFKRGYLEFQNYKKINFPNICIICGKETNVRLKKEFTGIYDATKRERTDLKFKLPICFECKKLLNGSISQDNNKKLKIFPFIGLGLAITLGLLTFSIIFGIAIFLLFFLPPFLNSRINKNRDINLDKYIQFKSEDYGNTIKLNFLNKDYAKCLYSINGKKIRKRSDSVVDLLK